MIRDLDLAVTLLFICGFLCCVAIYSWRRLPTFWRNISPPSSGYWWYRQYEHFGGTPVTTYKTTWWNNPEDHNPYFHYHENLKSHIIIHLSLWQYCSMWLTLYFPCSWITHSRLNVILHKQDAHKCNIMWDYRCSKWWVWRWLSSGILHHVVW
jgi:hypothetical protein